jgi:TatD DNase family protein
VIDTHAHLESADADAQLERAAQVGVERVIAVATSIDGAAEVRELAHSHPGVYACLGVHPYRAGTDDQERLSELAEVLSDPRVVAVGETGLDYYRAEAPAQVQRALFDAQLALADEYRLPVVIHSREADSDTLAALAGYGGTVVLHCFSSPGLLETALERRWYCSFAGNVTYPNAPALREAVAAVAADRLLAETDSPYLAPQTVRGQRNEPAYVMHTLAVLAQVRESEVRDLGAQIDANASAAFGL